jgi:hypothetical protein
LLPRCEQERFEDGALSGKRRMVTTGMAGGGMQLCKTYAAAECELSMKLMGLAWGTYPLAHPWAGLKNEDSDCPLRSVTRNACEDMYALLLHPVVFLRRARAWVHNPPCQLVERTNALARAMH